MAVNSQFPAGQYPNPTKQSTIPYQSGVLTGNIALSGSVSTMYDLSDWTLTAIHIPGTLASGTINFWSTPNPIGGTFSPVYDTAGNKLAVIATAGNQIIADIPELAPLRFIQLVTGGTQSVAQTINLIVK